MSDNLLRDRTAGVEFRVGDEVVTTKRWHYAGKDYPVGHTGTITAIDGTLAILNDDQNQRYYPNEIKHREYVWTPYDRKDNYTNPRPAVGDTIRFLGMTHKVRTVDGWAGHILRLEDTVYRVYIQPPNEGTKPSLEPGDLLVKSVEVGTPKPDREAPTEEGLYVTAKQELVRLQGGIWYDLTGLVGAVLAESWITNDDQWPLRKVVTTEV